MSHECVKNGLMNYRNFITTPIGETSDWEFTVEHCKECKSNYLRAYMESNGFPGSGQWYMCRIEDPATLAAKSEKKILLIIANSDRICFGGVYWGGKAEWTQRHPGSPAYLNLTSYATCASSGIITLMK